MWIPIGIWSLDEMSLPLGLVSYHAVVFCCLKSAIIWFYLTLYTIWHYRDVALWRVQYDFFLAVRTCNCTSRRCAITFLNIIIHFILPPMVLVAQPRIHQWTYSKYKEVWKINPNTSSQENSEVGEKNKIWTYSKAKLAPHPSPVAFC